MTPEDLAAFKAWLTTRERAGTVGNSTGSRRMSGTNTAAGPSVQKRSRNTGPSPHNVLAGRASSGTSSGGAQQKRPRTNAGPVSSTPTRSVSGRISARTVSGSRSTMRILGNNANVANTGTSANAETSLYPHQKEGIKIARRSVVSMEKVLGHRPFAPKEPIFRGGLISHSTGSGKTVTALGIVLQYLERMRTPPYIFIVTTVSNKEQNGLDKYLGNLRTHFPGFVNRFVHPGVGNQEVYVKDAVLKDAFTARVHYFTFVEFASCIGKYGTRSKKSDTICTEMRTQWKKRGMVVIIDESHLLTKADLRDAKPFDESMDKKNEYQAILQTKTFLFKETGMGTKSPGALAHGRRASTSKSANPLLHIYAMTATPGTTPQQYIDTVNLVRPANAPIRTVNTFTNSKIMHHYVSVADLSNRSNMFAKVEDTMIRTPITLNHYAIIAKKLGDLRAKDVLKKPTVPGRGGDDEKPSAGYRETTFLPYTETDFLKKAKTMQSWFRASDVTPYGDRKHVMFNHIAKFYYRYCYPWFKSGPENEIKKMKPASMNSAQKIKWLRVKLKDDVRKRFGTVFQGGVLQITLKTAGGAPGSPICISPKLIAVVCNAMNAPGKQYIYTSDKTTLKLLAWLLHHLYGMNNITEDVKSGDVTNRFLTQQLNTQKGLRHMNFIALESNVGLNRVQNFMSGIDMQRESGHVGKWVAEEATSERMRRNGDGQNCKIIIVTGEMYTGVDVNGLRGVHLVEQFASASSHVQARGRAARAGGHAFLPEGARRAVVYQYHTYVDGVANEMRPGRTGNGEFMRHIEQYHQTKKLQKAMREKIGGGRQFLNASIQNKQNGAFLNGGQNQMNQGQLLFSTPDDVLMAERERGEHSKVMQEFQSRFNSAAKR